MDSFRSAVRRPRTWVLFVIVLGILTFGVYRTRRAAREEQPDVVHVERTNLTREVTVTARVEPHRDLDLASAAGGRVARVLVKVGDRVHVGQLLVSLDVTTAALELAQATANLAAARVDAELSLRQATRSLGMEKDLQQANLEKARQAVRDAKVELDHVEDVRQHLIREQGDESSQARSALLNVRKALTTYHAARGQLRELLASVEKTIGISEDAVSDARASLGKVESSALGGDGLSALEAERQLALERLRQTEIRSFADGVVVSLPLAEGEFAGIGTTVVRVHAAPLGVVADVPEADAVLLESGQHASVTFDALGMASTVDVTLARIDPAATIIDGVPTYRVRWEFYENMSERVRAGLTATVVVRVAERYGVFAVPQRAVTNRDRQSFVRVRGANDAIEERRVRLGLRGSDGRVEIIEGISEGDLVVVSLLKSQAGK